MPSIRKTVVSHDNAPFVKLNRSGLLALAQIPRKASEALDRQIGIKVYLIEQEGSTTSEDNRNENQKVPRI